MQSLAELEAVAVVKVEHNLGMFPTEALGIINSTLGHVTEQNRVGVVAGAFRYLEDYGRFGVGSSLDDSLSCSMLLKLNAGIAYPLCTAFANISRVFTRPRSL